MRTVPVQVTAYTDKKAVSAGGWVIGWNQPKAHYVKAGRSLCQEFTYGGVIFHTDDVKPKCMRCQRLERKQRKEK